MRYCLALIIGLGSVGVARAAEAPWTIERLFKDGWEIAGYTGASDIRASLILFKHKDRSYLVQCSTFFDVTRASRTTLNCYELH